MNLHEYQAKGLFAQYGLPVSEGMRWIPQTKPLQQHKKSAAIAGWSRCRFMRGGEGKAGGVKLADSLDEIRAFADQWIGKNLVTIQTDEHGQPVSKIYVESCTDIERELYLSAVIDRGSRRVVFMASTEGGVEIEQVAEETPEKILRATIDPAVGAQPYQGRELAFKLGLEGAQIRQFANLFMGLAKLFEETDCSLLEINPLVVTTDGDIHCLDAKINIDGNALYRQPAIAEMNDPSQEDEREAQAAEYSLNYVALEGNIGCMVNGAGSGHGHHGLGEAAWW
jgi:succinyl-CoA synthetase beta subunit